MCDTCTTAPSRQGQHVPTTWGNELGKLRFQSYRWDRRACVHAGLITHKTYMRDSRWKIKSERRRPRAQAPRSPILTMLYVGRRTDPPWRSDLFLPLSGPLWSAQHCSRGGGGRPPGTPNALILFSIYCTGVRVLSQRVCMHGDMDMTNLKKP